MNEAYHIIKSLSSFIFINCINSDMSCKCVTCKVGITDKETHEINEPVKSLYENITEYVSTLPMFTSEVWAFLVRLI